MNNHVPQTEFKPLKDTPFYFDCHKGISCFTECCARLRLILTPYDIIRMKRRLGLTSDQFLNDYTETVIDRRHRFPLVKLKMNEDPVGACPFVTQNGCTIYDDRPEACRLYPIGRASAMPDGATESNNTFFMVIEPHCQGFKEKRMWTLEEWLNHEGVKEYAAMNAPWQGIVTSAKSLGAEAHIPQKHQMFFMASYHIDKFREFIFKSKFLDRFEVDSILTENLKTDDIKLMQFGFDWIRFSLFGERTMRVKE